MLGRPNRWMIYVLWAAAIYNIAWGGFTVLFPLLMFDAPSEPDPQINTDLHRSNPAFR